MSNVFASIISVSAVAFVTANASAAPIANANATELAAHRIEKLVILKKINAGFLNHLKGLTLEILPDGGVAKPTFKITGSQQADEGKVPSKVEIILDEKGKPVTHTETLAAPATTPVAWPDKDPVTLLERAIHYIEDNSTKAEIALFNKPMKAVRISPANVDGKDVGIIEALSYDTTKKLTIVIGLDAKVISATVQ